MKECEKCGASNPDSAPFCTLCMTPFRAAAQPPVAQGVVPFSPGPSPTPAPPVFDERAGLPPTTAAVTDALADRNLELKSSMAFFNDAFFFWWDNILYYFLFGLAFTFAIAYLMFSIVPRLMAPLAASASPDQAISAMIVPLIKMAMGAALLYLVGFSGLLTGTVRLAQGYKVGVFNSALAGILNLKSIFWIMFFQVLATGLLVLPVSLFLASDLGLGDSIIRRLVRSAVMVPLTTAISAPFILAMLVYLDQNIKGLKAVKTAFALVGSNWVPVIWRFVAFGLTLMVLQTVTSFHIFGALIAIVFVPGISACYPWFVYLNLKKMREAKERRALGEQIPAAPV